MPNRAKRKYDEDPTKSDSDDETYGAAGTSRSRPTKTVQGKPTRKRQRRGYNAGTDDSDEISESDVSEASFGGRADEEEADFDEKTGRPKRKATKQRPTYAEESDESIEEAPDSSLEEPTSPSMKKKKSLVIKLHVTTPQPTPGPARRSLRARSGSAGVSRPISSEGIRRSSRIAHDETEAIVQLTDSGHHADIVRPGTRSPERTSARPRRGGKGLKKPPESVVYEEEEGSSGRSKEALETDELQALSPQAQVPASHDPTEDEEEESIPKVEPNELEDTVAVIPESQHNSPEGNDEDDDDDEDVISQPRRALRQGRQAREEDKVDEVPSSGRSARRSLRARDSRKAQHSQRSNQQESSDFEPAMDEGAEEDISDSASSDNSPLKVSQRGKGDSSSRSPRKGRSRGRRNPASDENESEELAEELQDLRPDRPRRRATRPEILYDDKPRRTRKPVDYRILRPDLAFPIEDEAPAEAVTPSRRGRGTGGSWQRSLFSTYGPFGGAGGPPPVLGGPSDLGAAGGVDSDSSDDEVTARPRPTAGVGGMLGMTPTSAAPQGFGLFPPAQPHGSDPVQGTSGTPANLGKIKDKSALADADPLGVDPNVNFDSVGGLEGHINQLKEMVALPLLYPEIFQRFHVTPPRGVLFHGPPGTGKTLLARALAASVSSQGKKVTFYMRKGADALSKWVGEAERQLRLLFEEARKTQPSIIFFDEIDGAFKPSMQYKPNC